ncbi:HAD-IB family hydrolase [Candidatus Woesearchaeota archaeon]|nr:HAD-IB family hydrolase [Candidatus Woesearchaeota archaeon]
MKKTKKRGMERSKKAVAVFFDLDKTLVRFNSAVRLGRYLLFRGKLPLSFVLTSSFYGTLYSMKLCDFSKMLRKLWKTMENRNADDILKLTKQLYSDPGKFIYPEMKKVLDAHKKKGHKIIIITQTFDFVAEIFAKWLKADALASSEIEIKKGRFTGHVNPCSAKKKDVYVREFQKKYGLDLKSSFAYSDNIRDLPMLKDVGHAAVVNPKKELRDFALRKHWEIDLVE